MRTCVAITLLSFTVRCTGFAQDTTALLIVRNIPLIMGTINDKPAYFLVDTGASVTLLNESLASTYDFTVIQNRYFSRHSVVGMGGQSSLKEVKTAKVRLGIHELNFINKSSDLDKISEHFGSLNISIAGIIGTDLLYFLGSKIDLDAGIIIFKSIKPVEPFRCKI